MGNEIEKRTMPATDLRVAGDGRSIIGYAAVFGSDSQDLGYIETLKRGCFADSLKRDQVKNPILCFWNHNADMPLGTTANGSLKLVEDTRGLKFTARPGKTSYARDAREAIAAGLVQGCSFGFHIQKDTWTDGGSRREIIEADLREVSPCTMPAYPETSVSIRNRRKKMSENLRKEAYEAFDGAQMYSENPLEKREYDSEVARYDGLAENLGYPTIRDEGLKGVERFFDKTSAPAPEPMTRSVLDNIVVGQNRAELKPFSSLGEQVQSVIRAGMPGGKVDSRLFDTRAATGLGETVPSDGGFLVQSDFSYDLLKEVFKTGQLGDKCWSMQLSGNSNKIELPAFDETSRALGSRFGAVQTYWIGEGNEITASRPKFRKVQIELNQLAGLCYLTDEIMNDAKIMEQVVSRAFVSELGFMVDEAIVNGSGSGQNLGILNSNALVTASSENGQAPASFLYENAIAMWRRLLPGSRKNAYWLVSPSLEASLYSMALSVGTGGSPVFMPGGGASVAPYATLFSRPILSIEQCQQIGTTGDVILANLSEGYILATKGGIKSDMSISVRFQYDEQCIRWILRLDGSPVLASPITPANSGDTLSHFVALETRS